jgi:hypothetical protein
MLKWKVLIAVGFNRWKKKDDRKTGFSLMFSGSD